MIILLIVIGTSIWVFFDAKSIGIKKSGEKAQTGKLQTDMGPAGWAICCLLLWIFVFPLYLCMRPGYKESFSLAVFLRRRFQFSLPQVHTQTTSISSYGDSPS